MLKIIIAEDHRMFRESIRELLTTSKIAEILGEASNGIELLELLNTHKPDLILMDISMPGMDGITATVKAIEKQPDVKVLCLSMFGEEKYYFSMVEAGAKGFVLKNAGIYELTNAIIEVSKGGSWFSSELIQKVIAGINPRQKKKDASLLTDREIEILKLICQTLTNEQIAEKINISTDTVKWHRANILSKTNCKNSTCLVIYAIKNKIIEI
jgi:DNA-binding NarL/FixJ family response regulator